MKLVLVLASLVLASVTHADDDYPTMRMKLRGSYGDFVKMKAPCGKEVRLKMIDLLSRSPFVEITRKGEVFAAVGDAQKYADRVVMLPEDGGVVGFFDRKDGKTVAVTVLRKLIHKGKVRVDFAMIVRDDGTCVEKWEGLADIL